MKKIKIMLMALLIIAAVGAALAFKVKSFGIIGYCGTTVDSCSTRDNIHFYRIATPDDVAIANVYCTDNLQTPNICVTVTNE